MLLFDQIRDLRERALAEFKIAMFKARLRMVDVARHAGTSSLNVLLTVRGEKRDERVLAALHELLPEHAAANYPQPSTHYDSVKNDTSVQAAGANGK